MSYTNFIETFWSKHIQTELSKTCVLDKFCDYKFQGEVKGGARLVIPGVVRPTVTTYVDGTELSVETLQDNAQFLDVDQFHYTNFKVGDIDAAQGADGVLDTAMNEGAVAFAETFDTYIASIAANGTKNTKTTAVTSAALALEAVDTSFRKLWDNGVPVNEQCELVVTPWFYNLFKEYLIDKSTNNPSMIQSGSVGMYNNAEVKMTNNIHKGATYYDMILRTKKAIASVKQIEKVEPYRIEKDFADAVKALMVFGAKVVRPKEIICIQVKES